MCLPIDNSAGIGLVANVRSTQPNATESVDDSNADIQRPPSFAFNGTVYTENVVRARNASLVISPGLQDFGGDERVGGAYT